MASRFPDRSHFDTSAPNDPKITLNTKKAKSVPHIYTKYPRLIHSLRVALWQAVFELQAIFRQVHRITQNDIKTKKKKK